MFQFIVPMYKKILASKVYMSHATNMTNRMLHKNLEKCSDYKKWNIWGSVYM